MLDVAADSLSFVLCCTWA